MLGILIAGLLIVVQCVNCVFEFPKFTQTTPLEDLRYFSTITNSDLLTAVDLGVQSINQNERLEKNLLNSKIYIRNGSISHAQYLETFPNEEARNDDYIARKILKSSLYLLNSKCLPQNINGKTCSNYFTDISLPESNLKSDCVRIVQNHRDGHYPFRRLLPAHYKDGFYKMFQKLPKPREITNLGINGELSSIRNGNIEEDNRENLVLTQWTQFIEHDLSKSVVTSMMDGTPIECCDIDYFKLLPRYVHPACAPLEGVSPTNQYERISCLNYVRSALAVDSACNFGPAEQLNEASGILDLSQLYGYTKARENQLRSFKKGLLRISHGENRQYPLLPLANNRNEFCALRSNSTDDCFMAGDSRVNSNPFTIVLYTIFLRNHNKIAKELKAIYPKLTDELLYKNAKKINIDIYRRIIYNEWLPIVLGEYTSNKIKSEPIDSKLNVGINFGITNEFAVAAIRFYLSMLPNALVRKSTTFHDKHTHENLIVQSDVKLENVFNLRDNFYKSNFLLYPEKLNVALDAMLRQKALKMDSKYAETLLKNFLRTKSSEHLISGTDVLAWDIQRGRDHGLQPYIKYLEICNNIKVNSWIDLQAFIKIEDIEKLKTVYKSVKDIDLIVGGISEQPKDVGTVGPTFTCIIGEQISNIRKWQFVQENNNDDNKTLFEEYNADSWNGAKLLCETTQLSSVPRNIFLAPSEVNPLVSCSELR